MSPWRPPSRSIAVSLLLAALAVACTDDEPFSTTFIQPTEVAVRPADFLGDVSCSTNAGAMRSYVVTLTAYDDADDLDGFTLGASVPTPCSFVAGFREVVVVGQRYTAEVDGYDVPPEALTPFGGPSSGSRQMRSATTGELIAPRWTTRCGKGAASAVTAALNQRVYVRPCDTLEDLVPSDTAVALSPALILGDDPCTVATTLDITEEWAGLPAVTGVNCGAEPVVFDAQADELYSFYITAQGVDIAEGVAGPLLGTQCFAKGVAGETVIPSCAPIASQGGMRLSLASLTTPDDEPLCPPDHYFDVLQEDVALNVVPLSCAAQAHVSPLEPGEGLGLVVVGIDIYDGDGQGSAGLEASCAAAVLPGKTVDAYCQPE